MVILVVSSLANMIGSISLSFFFTYGPSSPSSASSIAFSSFESTKLLAKLFLVLLVTQTLFAHTLREPAKLIETPRRSDLLNKMFYRPAKIEPRSGLSSITAFVTDPALLVTILHSLEIAYWTLPFGFILSPIVNLFRIPNRRSMDDDHHLESQPLDRRTLLDIIASLRQKQLPSKDLN